MAEAKGNGDALTPILSLKDDDEETALVQTFVSSPEKVVVDEILDASEGGNKVDEVRNEEKATIVVQNEENPVENGEFARKEKEEENGQDAMEDEDKQEDNEVDAIEEEEEARNDNSKEKYKEYAGANSNENGRKPRKRNRRKKGTKEAPENVPSREEEKPESSRKKKASKRVESMGMIFMCSTKTKKDCYRYKVLGLPANKKDVVEKVYKGMRLFLFDVDLRLLYGIYKAAGPGGSNIEPKAFKSAFPSQVKFTVLQDCLPLAEEKFKKVIKDNYYSRNKFDCQLKSEQVKNLCKLFETASKAAKIQKVSISLGTEKRKSADCGRNRKRGRDEERRGPALDQGHRPRERVVYLPVPAPAPAHAPVYAYERPLEMDPYRREPMVEHHGVRFVDLEPRQWDETVSRGPYLSYREREPPPRRVPPYREPSYREPLYSSSGLRAANYYPPSALSTEYLPVAREAEYRPPAALPTEYGSSSGLLARYNAASSASAAEHHAPAGLSYEYRLASAPTKYHPSAGAVRDHHYRY